METTEDVIDISLDPEIQRKSNHYLISNNLYHQNISNVLLVNSDNTFYSKIIGKPKFTEDEARNIIKQLLEAVKFLNDKKIIHRDIMPENILYNEDTKTIQLSNFMSAIYYTDKLIPEACGVLGYAAPEILEIKGYNKEVDIFSIGVIFYLLLIGKLPFDSIYRNEIIKLTIKCKLNSNLLNNVSPNCKDLLISMLMKDPKQRITVDDALNHPFIVNSS